MSAQSNSAGTGRSRLTSDAGSHWTWSEVDGVRTISGEQDGPTRARLMFGVGRADEDAAIGGISHLCEHLALGSARPHSFEFNGTTELRTTSFVVSGTDDDVVELLASVCQWLRAPGLARLEDEKRILRTEGQGRRGSVTDRLARARWGPQGPGLVGFPEWGLHRVTGNDVERWCAEHFVRDNAVLWLSKPPPARLGVKLSGGAPAPRRELPRPLVGGPAWTRFDAPGVACSMIAGRDQLMGVTASLISRRMTARLRHDEGVTYSVAIGQLPLNAELLEVIVAADAATNMSGRALDGLLATIDDICASQVSDGEIESVTDAYRRGLTDPNNQLGDLDRMARDELEGRPRVELPELLATLDDATPGRIAANLTEARRSLLLLVGPDAPAPPPTQFALAEPRSQPVEGKLFYRVGRERPGRPPQFDVRRMRMVHPPAAVTKGRLVVSADATSATDDGVTWFTGHHRTAPAVLTWADGSRVIVSENNCLVNVTPALWQNGDEAVAMIDQAVPPERLVPIGGRRNPPPVYGAQDRRGARRTGTAVAFFLLLCVPTSVTVLAGPPSSRGAGLATIGGLLAVAAAIGFGQVRGWLRPNPAVTYVNCDNALRSPQFPTDLDRFQSRVPTGFLLTWLIDNNLVGGRFATTAHAEIERVRRRESTGAQLLDQWGGILAGDMLSTDGRRFALWYLMKYTKGETRFFQDVARTITPGRRSRFDAPDDSSTYGCIQRTLDRRYRSWRRARFFHAVAG